ncbi:MAG: hypothetical protein FWG34_10225 [Oscillospiraceae bacterium]|nr:hypothetical protein [Oscillospiraceae bacterium]
MGVIEACKSELRNIAKELQEMKNSILRDFSGIDQEICASVIERLAESCNSSST